MLSLEYPVILTVIIIFVQMVIIGLIIMIMYFKLKSIYNKNIDSTNRLNDKLNTFEIKLTKLSDVMLAISKSQTEINSSFPSSSSSYSSTSALFDKSLDTINDSLGSPKPEENANLWNKQELQDPEIASNKTITAAAATTTTKISSTNDLDDLTRKHNHLMSTLSPSVSSTPPIPRSTPAQFDPSFDKADDNTPKDMNSNADQTDKSDLNPESKFYPSFSSPSSSFFSSHNHDSKEKNSNPELDSIEQEILTALKRLGTTNTDLTKESDSSNEESTTTANEEIDKEKNSM